MNKLLIVSVFLTVLSCVSASKNKNINTQQKIYPAAYDMDKYLPELQNKRVALLVNHTSEINGVHLLDTLLSRNINVVKIFAPEHGFRGKNDAGEHVNNQVDSKTGISIISLYGKNKKPYPNQIKDVDIVVFDIQDVGVRFYTYISSMHYMMQACAENNIPMLVLDRPNPNGDYFDGPVLKPEFKSFVGMHPIPVVHGLTVGELSQMINGEGWLGDNLKCDLKVIKCLNYNHLKKYELPIKPSPNLPNYLSIRLYPSLCYFEPTNVSIGRGTHFPFQVIGFPDSLGGDFCFTPVSIIGMSKNPKHKNVKCYGISLQDEKNINHRFTLKYFIEYYNKYKNNKKFKFNKRVFNLLAGDSTLIFDINKGKTEEEIKKRWIDDLKTYKKIREKYLLY